MAERGWSDGRVGRLRSGQYEGMFVQVEPHASAGFHIWLYERHPSDAAGGGWDIWADTAEDVDEWFADELSSVTWLPLDGG